MKIRLPLFLRLALLGALYAGTAASYGGTMTVSSEAVAELGENSSRRGEIIALDTNFFIRKQEAFHAPRPRHGGRVLIGDSSVLRSSIPGEHAVPTDSPAGEKGNSPLISDGIVPPPTRTDYVEYVAVNGGVIIGNNAASEGYDYVTAGNPEKNSAYARGKLSANGEETLLSPFKTDVSSFVGETWKTLPDIVNGKGAIIKIGQDTLRGNPDFQGKGGTVFANGHAVLAPDSVGKTYGIIPEETLAKQGIVVLDGEEIMIAASEFDGLKGDNIIIANEQNIARNVIDKENPYTELESKGSITLLRSEGGQDSTQENQNGGSYRVFGTKMIDPATGEVSACKLIIGDRNSFSKSVSENNLNGGAARIAGDIVTGDGNSFTQNSAVNGSGGALFAENTLVGSDIRLKGTMTEPVKIRTSQIVIGKENLFEDNFAAINGDALASGRTGQDAGNISAERGNEAAIGSIHHPANTGDIGADIIIGDGTVFRNNLAAEKGGAIFLSANRTLTLGSGVLFAGNKTTGRRPDSLLESSIHASANSLILAHVREGEKTWINDSIVTDLLPFGDPYSLNTSIGNSARIVKDGKGFLYYGGRDAESNGFGGIYIQSDGSLIITREEEETDGTIQRDYSIMGTSETEYEINGGDIYLYDGSAMNGRKAAFGQGSLLYAGDGSTLNLADMTCGPRSGITALVKDSDGKALSISRVASGAENDVTVIVGPETTAFDIRENLANSLFFTTSAIDNGNGTVTLSQVVKGLSVPLQNLGGNAATVSAAMESIRLKVVQGSSAEAFFNVVMTVDDLAEAGTIMQSASGESVMNAVWAANSSVKNFTDLGLSMAGSGIRHGNGHIWVGGQGNWDQMDGRKGVTGYEYNAGGYAIGGDYALGSEFILGTALSQTFGKMRGDNGYGSFDTDSLMMMLYGKYSPENAKRFVLEGYIACGTASFDGDTCIGGAFRNNADFDTETLAAGVYGSWTWEFDQGKGVITPHTGMEFITSDIGNFSETGDLPRSFSGARAQSWTIPVGVTMARACETGTGMILTPSVTVAIARDIARINPAGNVDSDLGSWRAQGLNTGRTALRVDVGVRATFGKNWSAGIGYHLESRSGMTNQGINGCVSYSF